jgi:hypothetical protein
VGVFSLPNRGRFLVCHFGLKLMIESFLLRWYKKWSIIQRVIHKWGCNFLNILSIIICLSSYIESTYFIETTYNLSRQCGAQHALSFYFKLPLVEAFDLKKSIPSDAYFLTTENWLPKMLKVNLLCFWCVSWIWIWIKIFDIHESQQKQHVGLPLIHFTLQHQYKGELCIRYLWKVPL